MDKRGPIPQLPTNLAADPVPIRARPPRRDMTPIPPTLRRRRPGLRCATLALLAGLCLPVQAQPHPAASALAWETLVFDRVAALGASSEDFTFHFRNAGTAPVRIVAVQTSCGCTTAALTKEVYAPGEGGDLRVTYRFGGQVGAQEKTVTVTTSDAPDAPTVLVLHVQIPELFTISPRLLWWSVGDAPAEKQADVAINPAVKAAVTLAAAPDPVITARLVARPDGHGFVLTIRPASTKEVLRARVDLRIAPEGLPPQLVSVYALVR